MKELRKFIRHILFESDLTPLENIPYKLRYPKTDTLVKVNIDKLLSRHEADSPGFVITNREHPNVISKGRIDRAKEFWNNYSVDQRWINPKTGERHERNNAEFVPSLVSFYNDGLGFTDGRHRIVALKELGYDDVIIEVPKKQTHLFKQFV